MTLPVRIAHQTIAIAIAALAGSCGGDDPPPRQFCEPDSGVVPTVLEVGEGMMCVTRRLSIVRREDVGCRGVPAGFGGTRLHLRGHPGTDWSVTIERTDGTPEAVCAAILDASCACLDGECSTERYFYIELGARDDEELDLVIAPGTYQVELCSR